MHPNLYSTSLEVKFSSAESGEFSGYASVFGNVDNHNDVIVPGAFTESLREHKLKGTRIPMHLMHRQFGGDGIPVGVWKNIEEDNKGLKVDGKISGVNTDAGRLLFERIKDGALGGLSIGYKVKPNGSEFGRGEAKRTLKNLHLVEISLVDDPSNPFSTVTEWKAAIDRLGSNEDNGDNTPAIDDAIDSVVSAILGFDKLLEGKSSPKDMAIVRDALRDAHVALTGTPAPDGIDGWTKSSPAIRVIERGIRDEFQVSHTKARAIATRWFDQLPREEGEKKAKPQDEPVYHSLLSQFKLPD